MMARGSGSATSGFHRAVFPGGPRPVPIAAARRLAAHQLAVLLSAGNPEAGRGLPRTGVRSARGVDLSACPLAGGRPSYFIDQHDRKMPARPYASGRCGAPFVPVCRRMPSRTRDYRRSGPHAARRRVASRRGGSSDAEDATLIRRVFESYAYVTELVEDKNTSIRRLRELLFGKPTEKTAAVLGRQADKPEPTPAAGVAAATASPSGEATSGEAPDRRTKGIRHGHAAGTQGSWA